MITVAGYLGRPSPDVVAACAAADRVVGSARALDAAGVPGARRIVLGSVSEALDWMVAHEAEPDAGPVVVLASGDPLLFGVVRQLRAAGLPCTVTPGVSSVAAAFAAVSLPWDDAQVVSAHGLPLDGAVAACRALSKVAVLTAPGRGVREIAGALGDVERWYVLAERLGEADERVRVLDAPSARQVEDVADPNVVLVLDAPPDDPRALGTPTPYLGAWHPLSSSGGDSDPEADGERSTPDQADATGPADPVDKAGAGGDPTAVDDDATDTGEPGQIVAQVVGTSAAARRRAADVDAVLGGTRIYAGPVASALPAAWAECDAIVSHLALGATTRLVAPLLADKRTDPSVVVVDEAGRFVVPLVGGHAGGGNDLARRIARGIGATPVVTTATDSLGVPALDTLGWPCRGEVAAVTRAILDGRPVRLVREYRCPLPPLPENVSEKPSADASAQVVVTDRRADAVLAAAGVPTVVLSPPSLVAGIGCNSGTSAESLEALLTATLDEAGLAPESLTALTTIDLKVGELGLVQLAARLRLPVVPYPADVLRAEEAPTPSETVNGHVGSPSVAEASVLARGAALVVPKRKTPEATCAVGRLVPRGRLSIVGLGPGSRDLLPPAAVEAIQRAAHVVGYGPYVRQIRDLVRPGAEVFASKMGTENDRTAYAIDRAREGASVALVCSGDPAVYAMASPVLERGTDGVDVVVVPGVTAGLAASALLGAPLGHDHAVISLSDLHTPWEVIERRLASAAAGDLVTVLYNPRSKTRRAHLPRALSLFAEHRPPTTPVAVVREAYRPRQAVTMTTLAEATPDIVDMNSVVVIGSSTTRYVTSGGGEQRMVTPRDYTWMPS